jgi:hypothetical protein
VGWVCEMERHLGAGSGRSKKVGLGVLLLLSWAADTALHATSERSMTSIPTTSCSFQVAHPIIPRPGRRVPAAPTPAISWAAASELLATCSICGHFRSVVFLFFPIFESHLICPSLQYVVAAHADAALQPYELQGGKIGQARACPLTAHFRQPGLWAPDPEACGKGRNRATQLHCQRPLLPSRGGKYQPGTFCSQCIDTRVMMYLTQYPVHKAMRVMTRSRIRAVNMAKRGIEAENPKKVRTCCNISER